MQTILLVVLAILGAAVASPGGAPVAACEEMTPQHGFAPQTSTSPYVLQVQALVPSVSYNVTVTSSDGSLFRGFMIQARDANGAPVGDFEASGDAQATDCPPGVANTATHTARTDKSTVSVTWNAPASGVSGINLQFSVVQVRETYWVNQVAPLP